MPGDLAAGNAQIHQHADLGRPPASRAGSCQAGPQSQAGPRNEDQSEWPLKPPRHACRRGVRRHQARRGTPSPRRGEARCLAARKRRGLSRSADALAVQGRPVEPDLQDRDAGGFLRSAPQAVRQAPAVRACRRPRVPGDLGAAQAGLPGGPPVRAVRRRQRDRLSLLHHVHGRGPRLLERDLARQSSGRTPRRLRSGNPDARAAAPVRSGRNRARRLRQARQLFRPADRPLVEAVPRLRDQGDRGHGPADRLAADARAAAGRGSPSCTATTASTT